MRNWSERGASKEKLNIGLGFYGRSFLNAKALNEPHGGTDDKSWAVDEGTPQYFVSRLFLFCIITECVFNLLLLYDRT